LGRPRLNIQEILLFFEQLGVTSMVPILALRGLWPHQFILLVPTQSFAAYIFVEGANSRHVGLCEGVKVAGIAPDEAVVDDLGGPGAHRQRTLRVREVLALRWDLLHGEDLLVFLADRWRQLGFADHLLSFRLHFVAS
jgi:hypothetical protein